MRKRPDSRGLGPAIHDLTDRAKDVDGRHEGGHDEIRQPASIRARDKERDHV
jgi:hypothetical protein